MKFLLNFIIGSYFMKNLESPYLSDNKIRQEIRKNKTETKVLILKAIGYPLESNYLDTPEIKVSNGMDTKYIKTNTSLIRN